MSATGRETGSKMRLSEAAVHGFARHESFYPRYGWFRKAYASVASDPLIFSRDDAPARIGVGKNMVNAIRFWGLAAKLIEEDPQGQSRPQGFVATRLGDDLFGEQGRDQYAEDPGTLWLLHWLLLAPPCLLPVWWIAFNDFHAPEFTRSDLQSAAIAGLQEETAWKAPHPSSIAKDIRALLQAYGPAKGRRSGNLIFCPLRELQLIAPSPTDDHYRFNWGPKATLPSEIVAYAALDYLARTRATGGAVALRRLAHDPASPGRIFKLEETDLAAALEPTVEQTRRFGLMTLDGLSHLVWSQNPAEIARAVLDDYYYRVWHGPDVDIRQLLDAAGQQVQDRSLADILAEADDPQPTVAARHSAQRDTLRVFAKRYATAAAEVEAPGPFSPYDGEVLLVADAEGSPPRLSQSHPSAKPVAAALPKDISDLEAAARETVAVRRALEDPAAEGDWAARRLLRERLVRARSAFEHALAATFGADSCRWVLLGEGEAAGMELEPGRGSSALSDAADIAYPDSPQVRNEMLNSNDLTSNARSARRDLLKAMVEHGDRGNLGFTGFGPEVAMYRAFVKGGGLHRATGPTGGMGFCEPTEESLQPAWRILTDQFRRARNERVNLKDVCAVLRSPPVGMKAGPVPVFITAGLLAAGDDIALYERGAFRDLTPELSERMADHPGNFTLGPRPPPHRAGPPRRR